MKPMYKGEAQCLADKDQVKALEAAGWSQTKKAAPTPKPAAVKPAPKAPTPAVKKTVAK